MIGIPLVVHVLYHSLINNVILCDKYSVYKTFRFWTIMIFEYCIYNTLMRNIFNCVVRVLKLESVGCFYC